ncbi:GPW/gp25 family protein [Amycolatopsis sp. cmx-4-61]|uniref:GPW/gp25 family protein n=1 Tax=Amycolatopsis sp. cmx-4-61 TaxID=2790937 RepID=UPI00397CF6A8
MSTDFIGAGWQFPLAFTPSGTVDLASGIQRLEQAMRLILTTYPGERPMRPEFGSYLRDYVFEPATLDNATALAAEVRRALEQWESRVEIDDVAVYPAVGKPSLLYIDISYTVRSTSDERNLVFPFYTIPEGE